LKRGEVETEPWTDGLSGAVQNTLVIGGIPDEEVGREEVLSRRQNPSGNVVDVLDASTRARATLPSAENVWKASVPERKGQVTAVSPLP
jgi:hypothetical protein